ncbi:unnamed protein product [Cunninghamella blakesleeana]
MAIEGHPMRNWKIRLVAVDSGKEHKGKLTHILDRVEYILHPTFENPRRVANCEPYMLQEKGWGEFDMRILLHFVDNLVPPEIIEFDLNFRQANYAVIHKKTFPDAPPEFVAILNKYTLTPTQTKKSSPSIGGGWSLNSVHRNKTGSISLTGLTAGPSLNSPQNITQTYQSYFSNQENSQQQQSDVILKEGPNKRGRAGRPSIINANNDNRTSGKRKDGLLIDDVYNEQDLENVHPIHQSKIEPTTRKAWGIPLDLDMIELARRLSRMDEDQVDQFQLVIQRSITKQMTIEETDDEIMLDLYSLGPELLNTLWDFTEQLNPSSPKNSMNEYGELMNN